MTRACASCDFWQQMEGYRRGECRAMAPAANGEMQAVWPVTQPDAWCGMWVECCHMGTAAAPNKTALNFDPYAALAEIQQGVTQ